MTVLLADQSFGMPPVEPWLCQPHIALGAAISGGGGGHVPGVCTQPLGELSCFHLERLLVEPLFAQHP